jgi:hypothetical protein
MSRPKGTAAEDGREPDRSRRLATVLVLALVGVPVVVGLFAATCIRRELRIDLCLDRGGRFDEASEACVFEPDSPPERPEED